MSSIRRTRRRVMLGVAAAFGLLLGLVLGGLWKAQPLDAWCTDRVDNFIMATGPVDGEVEAVYFLDCMTGVLTARVLGKTGKEFQSRFDVNVATDLAKMIEMANKGIRIENGRKRTGPPRPEIQAPQNPKYMMVTGMTDIVRGAGAMRVRPAAACVYVAEVNTGMLMAYAIPWSSEDHASNRPHASSMVLMAADQVTIPVVGQ